MAAITRASAHIAERYGLLVIITVGEGSSARSPRCQRWCTGAGWSVDAALLAFAGVGLTFGCWWAYFAIHRHMADALERL